MKRIFFLVFVFVCFSSQAQINPIRELIFNDSILPRADIILPPDSLNELYENPRSEHEYRAKIIFSYPSKKDTINDIGFRFRGNTSRDSEKKSFKISFNTFVKSRKYAGVEKLNFNGEHNDPSIMRSKLVWDLFRDLQVPAARANHVEVYINNEYYGLYMNVEHVDEVFLKSRFGNNNGNLFKCLSGANLKYIDNNQESYKKLRSGSLIVYELKTNESNNDFSGLVHFIDILNNTSSSNFEAEIEKIFNVDNYLKTIAVEILTGHWDNYIFNSNNYYLYQNLSTHKYEYIPYDVDNTFGIDWFGIDWTERNIYSWSNGRSPLYDKIMKVPSYKAHFTAIVKEILEKYYNNDVLDPIIDEKLEMIKKSAENDTYRSLDYGWTYDDFLNSFNETLGLHVKFGIKPFIEARHESALSQLIKTDLIEPATIASIKIYPNPFRESLFIESPASEYQINIFDLTGQIVFTKLVVNAGRQFWNGTNQDGKKLTNGIYLIEIKDFKNNKSQKNKIILMR